jgi:hypothetical protein
VRNISFRYSSILLTDIAHRVAAQEAEAVALQEAAGEGPAEVVVAAEAAAAVVVVVEDVSCPHSIGMLDRLFC